MQFFTKQLTILFLSTCSYFISAQTEGVLTCSFLPVTQTAGYQIPRNVLAVWIQDELAGFVKTKLRYVGSTTNDHLPYWASNSGGPANNAISSLCNRTDAIAGATLPSFTAKTFTWDGKGVNGTVNGSTVNDGIYQVTLQQTWGHLSNQTATYSYTFTKGPCVDLQNPADNINITGVRLKWQPTLVDTCIGLTIPCQLSSSITYTCSNLPNLVGLNQNNFFSPKFYVYPNPSQNFITVNYSKAIEIKILNSLGDVIYEEKFSQITYGSKNIDLSGFSNGIYLVKMTNQYGVNCQKIYLDK